MESLVGKTLKTENKEEYVVLNEVAFKNIKCVYTAKCTEDNEQKEKVYFQLSNDIEPTLIPIKSQKLLAELNEKLVKGENKESGPRKIKEDESIQEYFGYLDDYYKKKIVTNI